MEKYLSGVGEVVIVVAYGKLSLIKSRTEFIVSSNVSISDDVNVVSGLRDIHWEFGHYFNSFKDATSFLFNDIA